MVCIRADPNKGFVGKINGKMPQSGYGVYEKPLLDVALNYHPARILEPATLETLLNEISLSHPVVVWGTVTDGESMSWKDDEGNSIPAIHGEHARVVVGFAGKKESPSRILLLDPVYGKISMSTAEFLRNWAMLGNRALVLN